MEKQRNRGCGGRKSGLNKRPLTRQARTEAIMLLLCQQKSYAENPNISFSRIPGIILKHIISSNLERIPPTNLEAYKELADLFINQVSKPLELDTLKAVLDKFTDINFCQNTNGTPLTQVALMYKGEDKLPALKYLVEEKGALVTTKHKDYDPYKITGSTVTVFQRYDSWKRSSPYTATPSAQDKEKNKAMIAYLKRMDNIQKTEPKEPISCRLNRM